METSICWGAILLGLMACLTVMWLLIQQVRKGKTGRVAATIIQGMAIPFLGVVPMSITLAARWLARLNGVALFSRDGGNDGLLVGVGLMGMIVAVGAAVLFAAIMIFQALTGWGSRAD